MARASLDAAWRGQDRIRVPEAGDLGRHGNRAEARGVEGCAQLRVDCHGRADAPVEMRALGEGEIDAVKVDAIAREPGAIYPGFASLTGAGIALPGDPGADERESGSAAELKAEDADRFRIKP
jgi:hypothetical protein